VFEGESDLGEELLDEGGPVLGALEPILDDRGELAHIAGPRRWTVERTFGRLMLHPPSEAP